jgi:hypothetical protein
LTHPIEQRDVTGAGRKVLLFVASSPSDLTETESTARALAARGHQVSVAYLYSGSFRSLHESSLAKLDAMHGAEPGFVTVAIDVDQSQHAKEKKIRGMIAVASIHSDAPDSSWSARVRAWIVRCGFGIAVNNLVVGLRTWMDNNGSLAVYHRYLNLVRRTRQALGRFLMRRFPELYAFLTTLQLLRIYQSYVTTFRVLLDQRPYQAIVVPEDVVGPVWPTLIKVGLQRHVPTLILPYTLANQEEAFTSLRTYETVQAKHNRLAACFFPKWRMKQAGYDLVRMPSGHVFVHECLRISPPDPWMMNSGNAQRIAVDSQASFDYFLRAGIPEKKLTITGSHSQDKLALILQDKTARLQALRSRLGLAGEKPLLLISGCPNQLAGEVPACEFATMKALAEHVGSVLQSLAPHYHLVVRPHPNYQEFGALLKGFGVHSSLLPTAELVPLCDLFVAFASATIRWASACGIPTINYDVFNYGYGDFAASKGVTTVSSSVEFFAVVADMKPDSPRYKERRTFAQTDAAYWSVMDGQGLQRIEAVLGELRC